MTGLHIDATNVEELTGRMQFTQTHGLGQAAASVLCERARQCAESVPDSTRSGDGFRIARLADDKSERTEATAS